MEGLLPLLMLWIAFAVVGKITKANQAQRQGAAQKPGTPQRPAAHPQKRQAAPQPNAKSLKEVLGGPAQAAKPVQPAQSHASVPLEAHMHTPVMDVEGEGTEGIDCCHEYMLDQPQETPDFLPMTETEQDGRARPLLQGVIFSEILGRRPIRRCGGKRA